MLHETLRLCGIVRQEGISTVAVDRNCRNCILPCRILLARPTPWECHEMRGFILARAKKELTRADVEALAKELAETGIEEVGRFLKSPEAVFEELVEQDCGGGGGRMNLQIGS